MEISSKRGLSQSHRGDMEILKLFADSNIAIRPECCTVGPRVSSMAP